MDAPFDPAAVMADAQRKEALTDWGPGEFEGPLGVLLDDYADAELNAIGGRALREMTRLGASPYSMWRDIALTNAGPIATTLDAVAQKLQHLRDNLKTSTLREEFEQANAFRAKRD